MSEAGCTAREEEMEEKMWGREGGRGRPRQRQTERRTEGVGERQKESSPVGSTYAHQRRYHKLCSSSR